MPGWPYTLPKPIIILQLYDGACIITYNQSKGGCVIMKKLAVVLVIAAIALYAMPVFAGDAAGGEKSIFQKLSNEICGSKMPSRFAVKPVAKDSAEAVKYLGDSKVKVFQDMSDGIAQGSARAKGESLRTK